jgi:hypothetical protein
MAHLLPGTFAADERAWPDILWMAVGVAIAMAG